MNSGPRRLPSLPKIARTLHLGDEPECFHCGAKVPGANWATATGQLDRAHVIDRWCGGSDDAANLRPLCHDCHNKQPIFFPGDEAVAMYWFTGNPRGGGSLIRHHVNEFGEQMVFVHNGRMGLVFHDDDLMPGNPLVIYGAEHIHPFCGHGSIVDGFMLSGTETAWLRGCLEEALRLVDAAKAEGATA